MNRSQYIVLLLVLLISSAGTIDLDNLFNYADQELPDYITKDNTPSDNQISDLGATLGRVLFYDKNLSLSKQLACAGCHQQQFAFSDTALVSAGHTGFDSFRHSMRLVNVQFSDEAAFFWDERADNLEEQTTMPIQDHIEMGFSGLGNNPSIDSLFNRLEAIPYYQVLFPEVFGDAEVTEERIQKALAQFLRSIISFDSRFDEGLAVAGNVAQAFPNYTMQENMGKMLFLNPPDLNGAGCAGCHRPPEFDIDPNSLNNGITGIIALVEEQDYFITRAPTLRDIVNPEGELNGPLMHNGSITSLEALINHYNQVPQDPENTNLDPRLQGPGGNLGLNQMQRQALIAFLRTLSGNDIYTNPIWSDPFDEEGNLDLLPVILSASDFSAQGEKPNAYPNPTKGNLNIEWYPGTFELQLFDVSGVHVLTRKLRNGEELSIGQLENGIYTAVLISDKGTMSTIRIAKQ